MGSSVSLKDAKSKSTTSLKKKTSKTKPKKSNSNDKISIDVDVSEAAIFQRQLPTFYHPDRQCNKKNEQFDRLIKLVKTKDKWNKEEYIELLEHLILNYEMEKISNEIKQLS